MRWPSLESTQPMCWVGSTRPEQGIDRRIGARFSGLLQVHHLRGPLHDGANPERHDPHRLRNQPSGIRCAGRPSSSLTGSVTASVVVLAMKYSATLPRL